MRSSVSDFTYAGFHLLSAIKNTDSQGSDQRWLNEICAQKLSAI